MGAGRCDARAGLLACRFWRAKVVLNHVSLQCSTRTGWHRPGRWPPGRRPTSARESCRAADRGHGCKAASDGLRATATDCSAVSGAGMSRGGGLHAGSQAGAQGALHGPLAGTIPQCGLAAPVLRPPLVLKLEGGGDVGAACSRQCSWVVSMEAAQRRRPKYKGGEAPPSWRLPPDDVTPGCWWARTSGSRSGRGGGGLGVCPRDHEHRPQQQQAGGASPKGCSSGCHARKAGSARFAALCRLPSSDPWGESLKRADRSVGGAGRPGDLMAAAGGAARKFCGGFRG